MSRPIDGEGTFKYSIGRPGRESAFAVAAPPAVTTRPHITTAAAAATTSRRGHTMRTRSPTRMHVITAHHCSAAQQLSACRESAFRDDRAAVSRRWLHFRGSRSRPAEISTPGSDSQVDAAHSHGGDGDRAVAVMARRKPWILRGMARLTPATSRSSIRWATSAGEGISVIALSTGPGGDQRPR